MSSGVLFAVDELVIARIRAMKPAQRPEYISDTLEELYLEEYPERTFELDESWDAMHRALTDGSLCIDTDVPTGLAILGGELLYFDGKTQTDYMISAKSPDQVRAVYDALSTLSQKTFAAGYERIDPEDYHDKSREDLAYTLDYFNDSLSFWRFAANNGLWVLFTADL